MPLSRIQKEEMIEELANKMSSAQSVVFAHLSQINVASQTAIRRELLSKNAEIKMAKKTLIQLAVKKLGIEGFEPENYEGQIVLALSYDDPTVAPQVLKKYAKEHQTLQLLGGVFESRLMTKEQAVELADLPPREVLLGKLLGTMLGPVSGFARASSGIISGFVRVLDGHRQNLEG